MHRLIDAIQKMTTRGFPSLRYVLFVDETCGESRLLYGLVFPDVCEADDAMSIEPLEKGTPIFQVEFHIARERAVEFIDTLPQRPLAEALCSFGIKIPKNKKARLGLQLHDTSSKIHEHCFVPSQWSIARLIPTETLHSPAAHFSAVGVSISRPEYSISERALEFIKKGIGLDLRDPTQAARSCSLEYIYFPLMTPGLDCAAKLNFQPNDISVPIPEEIRPNARALVTIHYVTGAKETRLIEPLDCDSIAFSTETEINAIDLYLFLRMEDGRLLPVAEWRPARLRDIAGNLRLITASKRTRIADIPPHIRGAQKELVTEIETSQSTLDVPIHVGSKVRSEVETSNPGYQRPLPGFFAKGWDVQDGSGSRLSFWKWFQDVISSSREIVIADPYFDVLGIELLAAASRGKVTVYTCTALTSDDTGTLGRKERLRLRCSQLSIANVVILDLPLLDKGAPFHDRFIYSNADRFGFHISNSIQGAAAKHPLVATMMTEDVIDEVSKYFTSLKVARQPTTLWPPVRFISREQALASTFCKECVAEGVIDEEGTIRSTDGTSKIFEKLFGHLRECSETGWLDDVSTLAHIAGFYDSAVVESLGRELNNDEIERICKILQAHRHELGDHLGLVDYIDHRKLLCECIVVSSGKARPEHSPTVPYCLTFCLDVLASSLRTIQIALSIIGPGHESLALTLVRRWALKSSSSAAPSYAVPEYEISTWQDGCSIALRAFAFSQMLVGGKFDALLNLLKRTPPAFATVALEVTLKSPAKYSQKGVNCTAEILTVLCGWLDAIVPTANSLSPDALRLLRVVLDESVLTESVEAGFRRVYGDAFQDALFGILQEYLKKERYAFWRYWTDQAIQQVANAISAAPALSRKLLGEFVSQSFVATDALIWMSDNRRWISAWSTVLVLDLVLHDHVGTDDKYMSARQRVTDFPRHPNRHELLNCPFATELLGRLVGAPE